MTCRGYDAKAVKVSKAVKRMAAQYIDPHKRGEMIRSYVRIEESNREFKGSRKDKK